ncbi:MAG: hypothetical protein MUE38_09400 [Flavihumibacter sp.]|nr:hypothetical protein [Flavihumibacter sp.]
MSYSQIPFDWFDYRNKFGRYITYWGDIYSGSLWECHGYNDGFFIVPNHHLIEIMELNEGDRTPEKYRELGWEISDYRVIVHKYITKELHPQEFNKSHGPAISKSGQEFKDMFVFGAGASSFCCFGDHKERYENDQWRSPLGYDIFNERYEELCAQFEGVKLAIPKFELKNNTIEECLESDWNKYCTNYFPELTCRHINIQFYLQKLFQKISQHTVERYYRKNLYLSFVEQIKAKSVRQDAYIPVIVNFNYDTILDQFIDKSFHYSTTRIDEYIDWHNRSVVQFKPHGSSNWGWKFPKEVIAKVGNNLPAALYANKVTPAILYYKILGEYKTMVNEYSYGFEIGKRPVGKHSLDKLQIQIINDEPAYPALLLPFKEKDEFVMPYHHQTALGIVMHDMERLFLIGWKGSEQLFLEQLEKAKRIKEVIVVNPEFETVKANLEKHIEAECTWTHVNDFEAFIRNQMI